MVLAGHGFKTKQGNGAPLSESGACSAGTHYSHSFLSEPHSPWLQHQPLQSFA